MVCPSHIPLVQYYRFAKTEIWALESEKEKAEIARHRHEFRLERQDREQHERDQRLRAGSGTAVEWRATRRAGGHPGRAGARQAEKLAPAEAEESET